MNFSLLALETSASRCGVALLRLRDGEPVVDVLEHEGTQEHAERLLPMAQALLDQAGLARGQLDAVAFGQGPGGFTGLRVACGVAQGLGFALDIPVLPVVSHLAVASQSTARPGQCVVVALDARMNEVYLGVLRRQPQGWQTLCAPVLIPAGDVVAWVGQQWPAWGGPGPLPVLAAGDAWQAYAESMALGADWLADAALRPDARSVARQGWAAWQRGEQLAPELAAPLYVRDKVAFTTAERASGQGGNPRAQLPAQPLACPGSDGTPAAAAPAGARPAAPAAMPRAMTAQDLDAVTALEQSVQAFPWTRGNFADVLQAGYDAWVIDDDGGLAAFYVSMPAPDVAHLLVIAVRRDRQGDGLGKQLLAHCVAAARRRELEGVVLEVRPSNGQARDFYRAQGFEQIGVRKNYYPAAHGQREDALILRRVLPAGQPR